MLVQAEALAAGVVVAGRFRLERVVGEGGMGQVWAARELPTERPFALKFLREARRSDPVSHARFMREAHAAMAVKHPNVAPVHAVMSTEAGTPFLVLDLLEGESLRRRLRRQSPLALAECAYILGPVIDAVRAAHAAGVVHRDLKPENIFLTPRGVLVLDFGIAKMFATDGGAGPTSITSTGAMLGTPVYMAPEQIYGEPDIDTRADVWALGVIVYECLAGVRPTEGAGIGQIIKIITSEQIPPLHQRALTPIPHALSSCVSAMLSRRREDRPPLSAIAEILATYASAPLQVVDTGAPTLDTGAPMGVVHSHVSTKKSSSNVMLWIGLVLLFLMTAAASAMGLLWFVMHRDEPSPAGSTPPPSSSAVTATVTTSSVPAPSIGNTPPETTTFAHTPARGATAGKGASDAGKDAVADAGKKYFDMSIGRQAGFGTANIMPKIRAAMPAIETCFPPPNPTEWDVSLAMEWPKGGGHRMSLKAGRNRNNETSPEAQRLMDCVKVKLEAANIPDANGQADIDGGPSYFIFGFAYYSGVPW